MDDKEPNIIVLYGEKGTGKTSFIKKIQDNLLHEDCTHRTPLSVKRAMQRGRIITIDDYEMIPPKKKKKIQNLLKGYDKPVFIGTRELDDFLRENGVIVKMKGGI